MQEIIVYIIIAVAALVLVRYIYRQARGGKDSGCHCDSCQKCGKRCQ